MESLIRWWVRNPVAANLLMLVIVTAGGLGLWNIEKETFPSAQPDIVQVEVIWPGASPKEVEQQIIQRVEEVLKNVSNVFWALALEKTKIRHDLPPRLSRMLCSSLLFVDDLFSVWY